jgi:hypothetical protein
MAWERASSSSSRRIERRPRRARASSSRIARGVALILCSLAAVSHAGPPFLTGDPDTVERGHWENSVGVVHESRTGARLDAVPAFEVNYGVAEGLELSFESAWLRLREDARAASQRASTTRPSA